MLCDHPPAIVEDLGVIPTSVSRETFADRTFDRWQRLVVLLIKPSIKDSGRFPLR